MFEAPFAFKLKVKLLVECGPSFTSKAEGMLKDMDASKKLMKEFKVSSRYRLENRVKYQLNMI
jgi:Cullin family